MYDGALRLMSRAERGLGRMRGRLAGGAGVQTTWGGPDEIECLGSGPVGLVTSAVGEGLGPPLQGRDVVWMLSRGFRPGLLEAALQAECLWELICGGRNAVFVCGGISAIGVQERDPAQGRPNLEYGASAVLPCGVIPASDLRGWFPAQERFAN